MAGPGFSEQYSTEIIKEHRLRVLGDNILDYCGELMRDFGYFDERSEGRPLTMPEVEWPVEGIGSVVLEPYGDDYLSLYADHLDHEVPAWLPEAVTGIDFTAILEDTGDSMALATIKPLGGPDDTTLITGFQGNRLPLEDLVYLIEDLMQYRALMPPRA